MQHFDIILFDIKGYSKMSETQQMELRSNLKATIQEYFKELSLNYYPISTGDGYYISLPSDKNNNLILLDFIAHLMSDLESTMIRYALHTGPMELIKELNETEVPAGTPLNDLNRYLTDVKAGNIIYVSRAYYEKYISGVFVNYVDLGEGRGIMTYKQLTSRDKHNKNHEVFNIAYIKDGVEYGFEIGKDEAELDTNDNIEFEDFTNVIQYAFGQRRPQVINKVSQSKPPVHYCYAMIELSQYSKEFFLFIKNESNKLPTLEYISKTEKLTEPLTICVNRKYFHQDKDRFWEKDFINKFKAKFPALKKYSFTYFDDFIWKNCISESLKKGKLFNEEKNYINPEFEIKNEIANPKVQIDEYLTNFITNDPTPVGLLKGPGGMGKTTLLKRISDITTRKENSQKFVFFIDGQVFAKRLRSEETNFEKIESLPDLLKFYFSILTQSGTFLSEAPILLNDDLVNIIVSSGNVVLIIDGLDEISGFLKSKFDLNTFMIDIININKLLNHSKILIATRDYYWENELSKIDKNLIENFKIIDLKGFNGSMANQYFTKKFEDDNSKVKKASDILRSLTNRSITNYWPFLVYLVSDIVLKSNQNESDLAPITADIQSKYLKHDIEFDNIIINFSLREKRRQNLELDIDEFLDLFKEIIIDYQGEMNLQEFKEYIQLMFPSLKSSDPIEGGYNRILVNPLLKQKEQKVMMSIDFINYHLTSVFLSYFIQTNKHTLQIYKIFSRYYDGEDELLKDIVVRLKKSSINISAFTQYIKNVVLALKKEDLTIPESNSMKKCISTFLYLAFRVFDSRVDQGTKERTSLLLDLFSNSLDNVHIYGDFWPLDFSSLIIRNSSFVHFNNILKSPRDEKTKLIDTKVILTNIEFRGGYSWNESNFDTSCILSGDFKTLLKSSEVNKLSDLYSIKKDVYALLKRFQRSGRFKLQTESHLDFNTSSKLSSTELIYELKGSEVISNKAQGKYNWMVTDKAKDSVTQLIQNDHLDVLLEKLVNDLYKKYYK